MYIDPQELLYVVSTICLVWVTGFLCWTLYETARFMRQSNDVMTELRERLEAVEAFVDDLIDKMGSLSSYLGVLSNAGEKVIGLLGRGSKDDEEEPRPKRKKSA